MDELRFNSLFPEQEALSSLELATMQQILNCTHQLVELALQAKWNAVLDGMDTRRCLLQDLLEHGNASAEPIVALSAAVAESERALMRMIAHAIASTQLHGGEFALYH